jgi:hypothetical protein
MAFKLEEDEKKGVLQLNYNGVIDKITLWNARSKLASMVEKTGIKNVFIDMRGAKLDLDSVDEYQFSSSNNKYLPRGTMIAALISQNDPQLQDYKYVETVSLTHGFQLKVFWSMKEAEQWLFRTYSKIMG